MDVHLQTRLLSGNTGHIQSNPTFVQFSIFSPIKKKKNYKKKKKRKRSHIFSRQTWTAMLGLEQSVHFDVEVWHNSYPLIDKSLFGTTRCDQKESREQNGSDLWLLLTENHNRHAEGRNPKLSLNTFLHYHSSYTFKLISFAGI